MVCTSSPSSCLVWGIIPPMVTGRQICGYCENIYQVHKGRLTKFIKEKNKTRKEVYISTYILIVLLNVFIVIYYCAYVSSFHTPPFFSISRLLSSRAFWSRDSSPWRLSCSFEQMKDTRKPLWVTSHYISHSVTVHSKNRWLAFFLCNICTQLAETRKFPGQREDRKQSIPVISNRAVLLCYYIGV